MGWFLLLPSPVVNLVWNGSGWRNACWGDQKIYKTRRGADALLTRLEKEGMLSPNHRAKVVEVAS